MNNNLIIRVRKAFFDPDQGKMPIVGIWHGTIDELIAWLYEQDYEPHKLEVAPFTRFGIMLKLTQDPNRPDEVADFLGADLDEIASYDHDGDWQSLPLS